MAGWSKALSITARCFSALRVCPDGRVDLRRCQWLLTICLRRCHWLLAVSQHWGSALMAEWSKALPMTAHYLSKALPLTAGCLSPLEGLPWWPSGRRRCQWLLNYLSRALPLNGWLSFTTEGSDLMAERYKALPMTAHYLSPLPGFKSQCDMWECCQWLGVKRCSFARFSSTTYTWLVTICRNVAEKSEVNRNSNDMTTLLLRLTHPPPPPPPPPQSP